MNKKRILLVDDELSIKKVVEQALEKEGFHVLYAGDGHTGWEMFQREKPDLVILDIMLPEKDGFDVLRLIREVAQTPVMMLSAKTDIIDKSVGFNLGADDYLTKPFSTVELVLRVKALIRRSSMPAGETNPVGKVQHQDITIDCKTRDVIVRGQKVELTAKEFDLLCFLANHPEQVFTREQLFKELWNEDYVADLGSISVFVRRIRTKIEEDPSKPRYLKTVWGVGYKFSP
ncbi:MAG: response regulator transcription factor [Clostridia bacterium]|nr:response regulator transcription factor [Clostridia bacterium]